VQIDPPDFDGGRDYERYSHADGCPTDDEHRDAEGPTPTGGSETEEV
jgi:hypothetical protein